MRKPTSHELLCDSLLISTLITGGKFSLLQKLIFWMMVWDQQRSLQVMRRAISCSFSEFKVYGHCLKLSIWYLCGSSPASETNNAIDELRKSLAACCLRNTFPPSTNSLIWAFSRTQLICKNRWLIHKCSIKIHTWLPRQHCLKNKWGDKWVYSQSS